MQRLELKVIFHWWFEQLIKVLVFTNELVTRHSNELTIMNDDDHFKTLTKSRDTGQLTRMKSGHVGMVHISCWFCIEWFLIKALRIIVVPLSLYCKHCSLNCNPLSCDTKVIMYNTSGLQSDRKLNKIYVCSLYGIVFLQTSLHISWGVLKVCGATFDTFKY